MRWQIRLSRSRTKSGTIRRDALLEKRNGSLVMVLSILLLVQKQRTLVFHTPDSPYRQHR
ncbi:hypothetical protein O9929_00430 [Vibrio lentus]|nr:hypothetical protein [Vibrio lentus]